MNNPRPYARHALELRAAEYYVSIRKPESEWKTLEDLTPQLREIEQRLGIADYDRAAKVLYTIAMDYLFRWGHYARLGQLWEQLQGHLTDRRLQVDNLGELGCFYYSLGECDTAIHFHQQAIALAQEIGYQEGASLQLGRLGIVYRSLFELAQAEKYHNESLYIARSIGNRTLECFQLGNLGTVALLLGQYTRALELYTEATAMAHETGNRWEEGIRLGGIGRVQQALGFPEQAIASYQQVLAIAQPLGDRLRISKYLQELAHSYASLGQLESARTLGQEGLRVAREIQHRWQEALCLLELGRVSLLQGNFSEAEHYCIEVRQLGVIGTVCQALLILGITQLYQQQLNAPDTFLEAIARCRTMLTKTAGLCEPQYTLALARVGQAVCDSRWGDPTQRAALLAPALTEYHRALAITAAPGVVRAALRDLDLLRAAGIAGLEPVLARLEEALPR